MMNIKISLVSEKSGYMSFNRAFGSYVVVWIFALILQLAVGSSFVIWIPAIFASFFAIGLRLHIVKRYHINECSTSSPMNEIGECCTGFWCWYCSVAQMARYMYGYTKVLDGDADINRDDNYERV